jgi:hypothetical protein
VKQLIEISKKFASASTVIGFTRTVRAETKVTKICWVLMTLISLAFGLYLTSGTIKEYLEYDVFTQTKLVQATSSLIPSITFCIWGFDNKDLNSFFDKAEFSALSGFKGNLSGEQFHEEGFGDCIKFNHYTNKSENKLFSANTLNDNLYFKINLNTVKFRLVDVFLSDNYDNILDWSQYITRYFDVKNLYDIEIKKKVEFKLEEPFNRCQNVSDITYRQTNCLAQCRNRNFASRYNCTLRNFYSISGDRFCKEEISNFSEFNTVCEGQCPKECSTTKFDLLLINPDVGSNFNGTVEFYVFYLDLSYTEIRQTQKMSGYSLLNEIGGALGLFVGFTFLSLFEFLEYLFEIFFVFYK